MPRIKIEYEVDIPEIEATEEELHDFIEFTLEGGSLAGSNPYYTQGVTLDPIGWSLSWEFS